MIGVTLTGTARVVVVALAMLALPAQAQQPSANAVALAKEIIVAKGSATMYDPIIGNIIERSKGMLLQTNPMLSKDLNEVAAKIRSEQVSRSAELLTEVAKLYATTPAIVGSAVSTRDAARS